MTRLALTTDTRAPCGVRFRDGKWELVTYLEMCQKRVLCSFIIGHSILPSPESSPTAGWVSGLGWSWPWVSTGQPGRGSIRADDRGHPGGFRTPARRAQDSGEKGGLRPGEGLSTRVSGGRLWRRPAPPCLAADVDGCRGFQRRRPFCNSAQGGTS